MILSKKEKMVHVPCCHFRLSSSTMAARMAVVIISTGVYIAISSGEVFCNAQLFKKYGKPVP
jgi:hypothetical protein